MMELFDPVSLPSTSLSMLLYLFHVLDMLFLTNMMGLSMLFLVLYLFGNLYHFWLVVGQMAA